VKSWPVGFGKPRNGMTGYQQVLVIVASKESVLGGAIPNYEGNIGKAIQSNRHPALRGPERDSDRNRGIL